MILNPWMIEDEEDFRGRAKRYFRRRREVCCRQTNHGAVKIWNNHQSWRSHELHLLAQFPCPFFFPMLRRRQAKKKLSALLCSAWLLLLSSPVNRFFLQQNFACSSNERMMHTAGGRGRGTGTGGSPRTELGAAPKWERVEREKGRLSSPWKGFIWYKLAGTFQKAQPTETATTGMQTRQPACATGVKSCFLFSSCCRSHKP